MKHYGDIKQINGSDVPPVNVIIGGSPCQDLSVAGKRAGLSGERSGLFMEQIRIIKEMRSADEQRNGTAHVRPRYMVWENVPGALSSNKGQDFRAVLEETARIVEKNLLERLSFYCGDDCTMASLFDGIGGFPLIWETLNGAGTCIWASEIEEFPIAVTKYHFT